ncbi:hypothetical protein M231_06177 [Tremella mesenterica]|uniref:Uncharacterized protein n=1 Tax=Tremella mesenterica TaxID=5217 RepID=A0A4Q1BE08_TREME|nr:hypothetical protein M231_06177 [Tremella mesenterica]
MGRRGEEERMDIDVIGERGEKGSTDHRLWGDTEVNVISFEILEGESQTPLSFQYVKTQSLAITLSHGTKQQSSEHTDQSSKLVKLSEIFLTRYDTKLRPGPTRFGIPSHPVEEVLFFAGILIKQVKQTVRSIESHVRLSFPPTQATYEAVETQRERFEEASGVLTNQLAKMKHGLSAFLERINSPTTRITQACAIQEEQANGIVWDLRSLLLQVEHAGAQVVPGFVPSLPLREPPADAPPPMDLQALVYLTNVITKVSGSPVDEIDSLD